MTTAILDVRPAARPVFTAPRGAGVDLERVFGLDRVPARRPRLVCHWHRDAGGRLACVWEPDIALVSSC